MKKETKRELNHVSNYLSLVASHQKLSLEQASANAIMRALFELDERVAKLEDKSKNGH